MTWKEKLEKAEILFGEAKAILENPEASAEDKEKVEGLMAEAKGLKDEAIQLKDILDTAKTDILAHLKSEGGDEDGDPSEGDKPKEFKDWGDFLYHVWLKQARNQDDERLRYFTESVQSGMEEKQMAEATGASGGFLVPVEFLAQLQAVMGEQSLVRSRATIIRMRRRQLAIPVLDQTGTAAGLPHWFGGMRFYWHAEAEQKTLTEPTFRRVNLVAHKLIGYTYASDELLDDSAISLSDFLSGPLGFAGGVSWMEDYSFFMGTGAGQPRGVVTAPATIVVPRAVAGTIGIADVVNMVQNFLPSGRGVWFVTQSAMAAMIQMAGPAGNPSYFWQPSLREGVPGYLMGMPVIWTEKLPLMGTQGDILLADWRYYIIGDRQATTVESTRFDRWRTDETSWRVTHRVDGQPWLSTPLTYQDGVTTVSPFVVLGDVAS